MAIPYDQLPFRVSFLQNDKGIELKTFFETEQEASRDLSQQDLIEIREINHQLRITFQSDSPDARFYMDGLEVLPRAHIELDEKEMPYVRPCENHLLQQWDSNPLYPGCNLVVIVVNGISYYSFVKVITSHIEEAQYKAMIHEINQVAQGLSLSFVISNIGLGDQFEQGIPTEHLYRFMVINRHFKQVMAALSDLLTKVNYRTKKEYYLEPVDQAKVIDAVTIRYQSTHPESQMFLKTPHSTVDYDLPENQWLKKVVGRLVCYISEFIEKLDRHIRYLQAEIDKNAYFAWMQKTTETVLLQQERVYKKLCHYKELAGKMKRGLDIIKLASWYSQVSDTHALKMSPVVTYDSRYFALFRLYRELQQDDFRFSYHPSFKYQNQSTPKLYEVWGFLKVCEVFEKRLGFKPVEGWIYDKNFDLTNLFIPMLEPGTVIGYVRDDLVLRVVYDKILPSKARKTSLDNPVMIMNVHRRPDCMVHIYKDGVYIGSLLFEFKYRQAHAIVHESRDGRDRSQTYHQLSAYSTSLRSDYTYDFVNADDIDVVRRILIVYPAEEENVSYWENNKIKFYHFAPNEPLDLFASEVQGQLEDRLTRYSNFASHR